MLLETDMQLSELQKSTQTQMNFGKLELGNISPGCYPKFCFIMIIIINIYNSFFTDLINL